MEDEEPKKDGISTATCVVIAAVPPAILSPFLFYARLTYGVSEESLTYVGAFFTSFIFGGIHGAMLLALIRGEVITHKLRSKGIAGGIALAASLATFGFVPQIMMLQNAVLRFFSDLIS